MLACLKIELEEELSIKPLDMKPTKYRKGNERLLLLTRDGDVIKDLGKGSSDKTRIRKRLLEDSFGRTAIDL